MPDAAPVRPWAVVAVALVATSMVMLDTTIVAVALPQIAADLDAGDGIEWVITANLLALGIAQAPTGWIADRWGARNGFLAAIGMFSLASAVVAAAPNLEGVVAGRVGQGLAGGVAMPLATALIFEQFPPGRRGTAMGTAGAVVMLAPALGPVLSGYVVGETSWRWLLLIHVPLGLGAVVAGRRVIPPSTERRARRLDVAGLGLVVAALLALLIASSEASTWGLTSARFLATAAVGAALLAAFVVRSRTVPEPLADLGIFRSRTFNLSMVVVVALAMPQFARNVFVPVELQTLRGLSPLKAGLVLAPAALTGAAAMPLAGRWADRRGAREPIFAGLVLVTVATALLARAQVATPLWQVILWVSLSGLGTVLVAMPTTVLSLSSIEAHLVAHGAALRALIRQVAGALSTAVLATIIVGRAGVLAPEDATGVALADLEDAYDLGFWVAAAVTLVGVVTATRLPRWESRTTAVERDPAVV